MQILCSLWSAMLLHYEDCRSLSSPTQLIVICTKMQHSLHHTSSQ